MLIHLTFTYLLLCTFLITSLGGAEEDEAWKSDWALDEFFSIEIDTEGYNLPVNIAFVPNPGKGSKDPLYFITELRGRVKVVTNDRSVYTFAEDFYSLKHSRELPHNEGEVGLTGICLDSGRGYVFVTFAYQDVNKILRNNIMRFETKPETFSVKPGSMTDFSHVFSADRSGHSHQIGPCQVFDNLLYVSLGDGNNYKKSGNLNSTLGKILRMTLDGRPPESNPFYVDDSIDNARDYVWAYGFRNPFGLKVVDGRVFVVENGLNTDRFIEVQEGVNYLWDGSEWSLGANSDMIFSPSVGPVQFDYYPQDLEKFPDEFRNRFYLTLGGGSYEGPGMVGDKSIVMIDYGFKENRLLGTPKHFLKYRGDGLQVITGLGIGHDGLYIVPLFPNASGRSPVLKVSYDNTDSYPYKITDDTGADSLLADKSCLGCHKMNGKGWGDAGPNLDRDPLVKRLSSRLNSSEYIESVREVDKLDFEPYKSHKEVRSEVLNAEGFEKIRIWVKHHLLEPKFDNPASKMPNMGLTENEALILTTALLDKEEEAGRAKIYRIVTSIIPELRYRYLVYSLLLGFILCLVLFSAIHLVFKRKVKQ